MDCTWGQSDLACWLKGQNLEWHAVLSVLLKLSDTLTGVTCESLTLEGARCGVGTRLFLKAGAYKKTCRVL